MLLYWKCFLFVDVSCADLLLNKSSVDFQNTPPIFLGGGGGVGRGGLPVFISHPLLWGKPFLKDAPLFALCKISLNFMLVWQFLKSQPCTGKQPIY